MFDQFTCLPIVDLPPEATEIQVFQQLLIPLALNQFFACSLVSLWAYIWPHTVQVKLV